MNGEKFKVKENEMSSNVFKKGIGFDASYEERSPAEDENGSIL